MLSNLSVDFNSKKNLMDFKQIVSLLCVIAFIAVVATGQPEEHIGKHQIIKHLFQ